MDSPTASIIIPTRNRRQALEYCLDALAAQTMPSGSFEVIVVDDGSNPAIFLDPARWASKFALKLIHQQNTGPAGARNRGAVEARGEFLAFTDDDCLPTPTWLEKLIAALQRNPDAMIGGSTFNGLKENLFSETSQLILEMVYEHFNCTPANAYFFASNNMACRRDRYMASGGFDADFDSPAAEDREFCDRWRMQARPLMWRKCALIEHRHAQTLAAFCRLHFRYGQGAFLYQSKRRLRGSGTMARDLGFHRSLPKLAGSCLKPYSFKQRVVLAFNLILWQIANAAGFAHVWASRPAIR
jgi:glycosyltransferase involved in cell wall biosynthesis